MLRNILTVGLSLIACVSMAQAQSVPRLTTGKPVIEGKGKIEDKDKKGTEGHSGNSEAKKLGAHGEDVVKKSHEALRSGTDVKGSNLLMNAPSNVGKIQVIDASAGVPELATKAKVSSPVKAKRVRAKKASTNDFDKKLEAKREGKLYLTKKVFGKQVAERALNANADDTSLVTEVLANGARKGKIPTDIARRMVEDNLTVQEIVGKSALDPVTVNNNCVESKLSTDAMGVLADIMGNIAVAVKAERGELLKAGPGTVDAELLNQIVARETAKSLRGSDVDRRVQLLRGEKVDGEESACPMIAI